MIETKRLFIRNLNEKDLDDLGLILKDDETMYAYEGAFSDDEVLSWMEKQFSRYRDHGFGLWAVVLKDTGAMIGQCGLTIQEWKGADVLEVGYLFNKAYWHHGYATEAARACLEYAFEKLDAERVSSIIRTTNTASLNVARRNGMHAVDFSSKTLSWMRYGACEVSDNTKTMERLQCSLICEKISHIIQFLGVNHAFFLLNFKIPNIQ